VKWIDSIATSAQTTDFRVKRFIITDYLQILPLRDTILLRAEGVLAQFGTVPEILNAPAPAAVPDPAISASCWMPARVSSLRLTGRVSRNRNNGANLMKRLYFFGVLIGVLIPPTFILSAGFVQSSGAIQTGLSKALTFHASFDKGPDADFGAGDRGIYTAPTYKTQADAKPGIGNPDVIIARGQGRFGDALQFRKKNTMAVFYRAAKNVIYLERDWNGTLSFWLSLNPDEDLAPGYADPIQVTDKEYNNAAIWVDFTRDDKPRHFRLGVFGDLKVWNPKNLPPEQNPDFNSRTIVDTQPPFARGQWTQVVIAYAGLNTDAGGTARLYLNGRLQGTATEIREPFTWNISQAAIRLGVNYVGLFDDLCAFNRPLSDREVEVLYQLKGGAASLHR
jgi:hypothetical protein